MRRLYVKNERERGGEKEDETERGVRKQRNAMNDERQ